MLVAVRPGGVAGSSSNGKCQANEPARSAECPSAASNATVLRSTAGAKGGSLTSEIGIGDTENHMIYRIFVDQ